MNENRLFSATSVLVDSVTAPAALTSCATCSSTAGEDDRVMAATSTEMANGTLNSCSAPNTTPKVSPLSRNEVMINEGECRSCLMSSDRPSLNKISASAMSISTRELAMVCALNKSSTLGPHKNPTSMNPVMLGSHDTRCER